MSSAGFTSIELAGEDTDHRVASAVKRDPAADDILLAAESRLPEGITEQHRVQSPGAAFLFSESAAVEGRDAQQREESGRGLLARNVDGLPLAGKRIGGLNEGLHIGKHVIAPLPIVEVGRGNDVVSPVAMGIRLPQHHQLMW